MDVTRIRRDAETRRGQGLVSMILTVDEVLRLLAEMDVQAARYEMRIAAYEGVIRALKGEGRPGGQRSKG